MVEQVCILSGSLENPSKDRQRFVDAVVLISAADWSKALLNFENIVQTPFLRTSNDARFCQTVGPHCIISAYLRDYELTLSTQTNFDTLISKPKYTSST